MCTYNFWKIGPKLAFYIGYRIVIAIYFITLIINLDYLLNNFFKSLSTQVSDKIHIASQKIKLISNILCKKN